ncbi:MAG: hypothetical protein KAT77_04175 [Nanoarchaeota archaeon]|nr:hypothetical protein [Nanoarchaeota archaeon]
MKSKKLKSKESKLKNKHTWHQIELTVAIVLSLVIILSFFRPTITGFVSAGTYSQNLDLVLDKSTIFLISAPELVEVTSFKLTGEVEGAAKIYLDNMEGQRLLVYENLEKPKKGLGLVTGMAIGGSFAGTHYTGEKILEITQLDGFEEYVEFDKSGKQVKNGPFEEACQETCFIKMEVNPEKEYKLIVLLEEGTCLKLEEVVLTVVGE